MISAATALYASVLRRGSEADRAAVETAEAVLESCETGEERRGEERSGRRSGERRGEERREDARLGARNG